MERANEHTQSTQEQEWWTRTPVPRRHVEVNHQRTCEVHIEPCTTFSGGICGNMGKSFHAGKTQGTAVVRARPLASCSMQQLRCLQPRCVGEETMTTWFGPGCGSMKKQCCGHNGGRWLA